MAVSSDAPRGSSYTSRPDWLGARAALAGRRSGRFALAAIATFAGLFALSLAVPRLTKEPLHASTTPVRVVPAADTARLRAGADSAHRAMLHIDSLYDAAIFASEYLADYRGELTPTQRSKRDSLQRLASELDVLIARAATAPLADSYHALSAATALHGDPRTKKLVDSLDALEMARTALVSTSGADASFGGITALVTEMGAAIRDGAVRRRAALAQSIARIDSAANGTQEPVDTIGPRRARDSISAVATAADSALIRARRLSATAGSRAVAGTAPAAAVTPERVTRRIPPVAMLVAALIVALIAGFSFHLSAEIRRPTLATPREAERLTRAPILAVAREGDRPPRIGGIDPFRMLYLGLTATGTRTRTVVISGDNRDVAATVAGRLALAAAADARATLVVDADAEGSGVAAFYDDRPEPGFSDALAGVRLWREVTRSVGASDGLSIDVVPGGTIRRDDSNPATAAAGGTTARDPARDEFARFRAEYDFCIVVAPSERALMLAVSLTEKAVTVLCAELAHTTLERLRADAAGVRMLGASLHGLAIWDAELPHLAPRAALMSKTLAAPARRPAPEAS